MKVWRSLGLHLLGGDVGISHSKKSPLIARNVCTYVNRFANKTGEGLHGKYLLAGTAGIRGEKDSY